VRDTNAVHIKASDRTSFDDFLYDDRTEGRVGHTYNGGLIANSYIYRVKG